MENDTIHRGEFLKNKIKESGVSYIDIVNGTSIGRTTLFNHLKNPNLPIEKMLVVTNFLGVDISNVFKIAKDLNDIKKVEKEIKQNLKTTIGEKYVSLLERYSELQSQLFEVKEELNAYKNGTKSALES